MRFRFFIILTLLMPCTSFAQGRQSLDSLQRIFPKLRGEDRYDACEKLSYDLLMKNDPKALQYCNEFLKVARVLGDSFKITYATRRKGVTLRRFDHRDSAMVFYKAALAIAKRNGFEEQQRNLLNSIGTAYLTFAEYEQSIDAFDEALILSRKSGDSSLIGVVLNNIGLVHYKLDNIDLSISNYQEALLVKKRILDSLDLDRLYINLGLAFQKKNDLSRSEENIRTGLNTCSKNCNDRIMSEGLLALGLLEQARKRYTEAIEYMNQSYAYAKRSKSVRFQIENLTCMADVYIAQKKYTDAKRLFGQSMALSLKYSYKDLLSGAIEGYINVYAGLKDHAHVMQYRKYSIALKKEIYSTTLSERIGRFQMEFEMRKREATIASQQQVMTSRKKAIIYRQYVLAALVVVGALAAGLIFLLYRQYRFKLGLGQLLADRVAMRSETLKSEKLRIEAEYAALERTVNDQTKYIRHVLTELSLPSHDRSVPHNTSDYVQKIKHEISKCLAILR